MESIYDENPEEHSYNAEWRQVYSGAITAVGLDRIRFDDREAVGLYLCPEAEAGNLLKQKQLPIASGLEFSLS